MPAVASNVSPVCYRYLQEAHGTDMGVILDEVRCVVRFCMAAVQPKIQLDERHSGYSSFQLFGFDFMLDADLKVWLIEVNASPATAA